MCGGIAEARESRANREISLQEDGWGFMDCRLDKPSSPFIGRGMQSLKADCFIERK